MRDSAFSLTPASLPMTPVSASVRSSSPPQSRSLDAERGNRPSKTAVCIQTAVFESLLAGPGGWGGTAIHRPGDSTEAAFLDGLCRPSPVGLGQLSARILTLIQNYAGGAVQAAGAHFRRGARIDLEVWAGGGA